MKENNIKAKIVLVGSGELKITESPTATGKLSGTFKFRAVNADGTESGFTNGVIYNIPVK